MYGMSEYLLIMNELEKIRLAGEVRKDNRGGVFSGREPTAQDRQAQPPMIPKEATRCP